MLILILILIKLPSAPPQHKLLGNINSNNPITSNIISPRKKRKYQKKQLNIKCEYMPAHNMMNGFYRHPYVPIRFHYNTDEEGIIIYHHHHHHHHHHLI